MNEAESKAAGVSLAVVSGLLIGTSFVFKKKGLVQSTELSGGVAGEGYSYLKSFTWWTGMILMAVGEICNFVAYAFTQAILVTPLGALTVVVSAVLSAIFLKERLSFNGKMGCFRCILGSIIIVLHAPQQSKSDTSMDAFKHLVLSPDFLTYAIVSVVLAFLIIIFAAPRWGKKYMGPYIAVCSLIGAISVVFTQGLGMAIVHSITVANQFTNYFTYIVLLIVVATLIVEIVYLNKALNLFNTALVTPTYYVTFTTLTIVSSLVLYQGFGDASPVDIATCVFGFLCICSGVVLLHRSSNESLALVAGEKSEKSNINNDEHAPRPVVGLDGQKELFRAIKSSRAVNPSSHQAQQAELLVPLFVGVTRYASTTRKSRQRVRDHTTLHEPPPPSIPVAAPVHSAVDKKQQQQQQRNVETKKQKDQQQRRWQQSRNNTVILTDDSCSTNKHVAISIPQCEEVSSCSLSPASSTVEFVSLYSSRISEHSSLHDRHDAPDKQPADTPKRWPNKIQSRLKRFSAPYKIRVKRSSTSSTLDDDSTRHLVLSFP